MKFKPRLTKPEAGNKYYIRKTSGGWSPCIKGSPIDKDCDVLSNCVGYAIGRFNELCGRGKCDLLASTNAENFIEFRGDCEVGQTPRVGAVICWAQGKIFTPADGHGHVAVVEKVISDDEIITSESAYGGRAFYTTARKKSDGGGNWAANRAFTFRGFIYPPVSFEAEEEKESKDAETRSLAYVANLRAKPSADAALIKKLPAGSRVRVYEGTETVCKGADGKNYVYIKALWGGRTGWLVKSALS